MKNNNNLRRIGFILNPLAGIGGKVGLKGSDGAEIVHEAFMRGAELVSNYRAREFLENMIPLKDKVEIITYPLEMGETEAIKAGFTPTVIGSIVSGETSALDTQRAAKEMQNRGIDLLIFVGGDGTARDICSVVGTDSPALGIPAGVKIHSSVFAINPRKAAELVESYLNGYTVLKEMEVMDIDEELFRAGRVSAKLFGYLVVPYQRRLVQGSKKSSSGLADNPIGIAERIVDEMEDDCYYILGPGTTVKAIGDELNIDKTLLGVDIVYGKKQVGKDLTESQIKKFVEQNKSKIVVTIIGGQGYIFGRGNQQISPNIIRAVGKQNIIIIATKGKLSALNGSLLVDTGDKQLDKELSGYWKITTGFVDQTVRKVEG